MPNLRRARSRIVATLAASLSVLAFLPSSAGAGGRLLATGGVTEIEGAGGGGIVPWALIGGTGTRDEIGASAFGTYLGISDFRLQSAGVAVGFYDRVELSYARQSFSLGSTVPGDVIRLDTYGAKLKLFGDAVYDQDRWWPQVAAGVEVKNNRDFDFVPKAVGARRATGTDFYLAATKLYLAGLFGRNVLVDATMRASRANQLGLLGFGGDLGDRYRLRFEGSAAVFVDDHVAIGGEYRGKPNNLGAFREQSFEDVFIAWVPTKNLAATVAWARLGRIADKADQSAIYGSLQASF